ncbi:MAG: SAM-dependent methyltransferase [Chlorobiaceae bacterium]|nr:SAM-dependent methyltransferase [Chlorobiaceae bacterium]
MQSIDRKKHWENIYQTTNNNNFSWYQSTPTTSLEFINEMKISRTSKIIDVGGGDSFFVDNLIELGFLDLTVLDISEAAISRAKNRLGNNSSKVKWIVSDVTLFDEVEQYDFWHDRAVFHFLTEDEEIKKYSEIVSKKINAKGILVIGTFSDVGPKKCSGLEIKQYNELSLEKIFSSSFEKIKSLSVDHNTPSGKIQNFIFLSFRKKKTN